MIHNKGGGDDNPNQPNSSDLITFLPPEWNVAMGTDSPVGTHVGTFESRIRMGFLNNGCAEILSVHMDLLNATMDTENVIALPPSIRNHLRILGDDSGNDVINGAAKWPDYLTTLSNTKNWDLSKLRSRLIGVQATSIERTDRPRTRP